MPAKPIDRLIFTQGGKCFFCKKEISKSDASVEHLIALTHGGSNSDENCVVCCKYVNNLFGRMSLKEKLQVILNQSGNFECPAKTNQQPIFTSSVSKEIGKTKASTVINQDNQDEKLNIIITHLKKQGNSQPSTQDKLLNMIKSSLNHMGNNTNDAEMYLKKLIDKSYIIILQNNKVKYELP